MFDSIVKRNRKFSSLSAEGKKQDAKIHYSGHNKFIKYKDTFRENVSSIKELKEELDRKNIKLFIVIAPFTKTYLQGIDSRYIDDFYKFCEKTNTLDGFIDCNKVLNYDDELFLMRII